MPVSTYQPDAERHGVALCLSGGGYRAALFHLGSLRRLNETGVLGRVTTITSVSGGSIANGLLARMWPQFKLGSDGVLEGFAAYEKALREFCSRDIRTAPLVWDRLDPRNWPMLISGDHSATDFLAQEYEDYLVPGLKLGDLPAAGSPRFIFCASNLQTGVNFEMSRERIGDYQIGHSPQPQMAVAEAVAASSAFPLAFPPLILKLDPGKFIGGRLGNSDQQKQMARRIVLTDGGVYDNLGLEPVWKTHKTVLCSDGGKPFGLDTDPGISIVARLLRSQAVIENQALAVRKRWLVGSFETGVYNGAYWGIGTETEGYAQHRFGYEGEALARIRAVRTDLNKFTEGEQLVLMNHGWALTDSALMTFGTGLVSQPLPPGDPPSKELLTAAAALAALG